MFHRVTGAPDVIGRLEGEVYQSGATKSNRQAIRVGFSTMSVDTAPRAASFVVPVLKLLQQVML
jgi:hypothetical protein